MHNTISVVIPTYDRCELLKRALDSVYAQTLAPLDVIVVDDGSTDRTADMVRECFPTTTVIATPRRGVSAARNRGIESAAGSHVAFLDSDDTWASDKLKKQMQALDREGAYVLCHTDEIWIRCGRRVNPGARHIKRGGYIFEHCLPLCAISPSSALVERQLLLDIGGFDEALPACEDYDLWLRICARYPVLYVDNKLVTKYGGHDDQLSRTHLAMDRFRIYAIRKVLEQGVLTRRDRVAALETLVRKLDIYIGGALKRRGRDTVKQEITDLDRYRAELSSLHETGDSADTGAGVLPRTRT